MKHKYIKETVPVIIRLDPKLKDKWRKFCFNYDLTYRDFIEKTLENKDNIFK